jgi:hypothetical protein
MSKAAQRLCFPLLLLVLVSPALGQEILPKPEPPFQGVIGRTAKDSVPDFPKQVEAPKGAQRWLRLFGQHFRFDKWNSCRV